MESFFYEHRFLNHITLVGFGLLASSVAAAIKQSKPFITVRAVSSPATLDRVRELRLADEFFRYDEVEDWSKDTELILLCGPILHILKMIDKLKKVSWPKSKNRFSSFSINACSLMNGENREILVSDIGSTKVEICKAGACLPAPFRFVGSHPMAGSEKRSCENYDPAIFENAYWFVCPSQGSSEIDYKILWNLIRFLGAKPEKIDPQDHDRTMAWVSHMPQMLSSTLAGKIPVKLRRHSYQIFAGRAYRDMTRIAASGWNMWHDIAVTNRDETTFALESLRSGIDKTIKAMKNLNVVDVNKSCEIYFPDIEEKENFDNSERLKRIFLAGNVGRKSIFEQSQNKSSFYEITIQLKDEPGALLSVIQPLAEEGINIRDIELMKVRENVEGTLLLAFKTEDEAARAVKILQYLEYEVKERC